MNVERIADSEEIAFLNGETRYFIHEGVGLEFDPQRLLFVLEGTQFSLIEPSNSRGLYESQIDYKKGLAKD